MTAETSRDGVLWDRDAEQEYYRHGPLRRLELGEDSIQGIDYTYTIHGWLKGVNHAMLTSTSDPGLDGSFSNGMKYPLDGFGMVLGYYAGDYVRRYGSGGGNTKYSEFTSKQGGGYKQAPDQIAGTNLYNGNIASWRHQSQYGVGMAPVKYPGEVGNVYSYDVLNRLLGSEFRVNSGGNTWNGLNLNPPLGAGYSEDFTYDANGNILTAVRDGLYEPGMPPLDPIIDQLTYQYDYSPTINGPHRNRLRYVSDGVATQTLSDLENQAAGFPPASPLPITGGRNYEYDGSGNLVYDRSEGTLIKWNAQGKVAEVRKDQIGVSQTTKFWYNAAGNRVKKQVINHLAADPEESSVTYYVRDANEAVMAIYQQTVLHASEPAGCVRKPNNGGVDMDMDGVVDGGCDKCTNGVPGGSSWNPWQEDYDQDGLGDACDPCPFIFGSVCDPQQPGLPAMPEMWNGVATTTKLAELPIYGSERLGLMRPNVLRDTVIVINPTPSIFTRRVDQKEYELKDHLGNVRVVVSDMKKRVGDLTATFTLRVKSVNAYYAFGMLEEGMSGSSEGYRYGFNGMEMDNELKGVGNSVDYGARVYDPRIGQWLAVDPLQSRYPGSSPYNYVENNPIDRLDIGGTFWITDHYSIDAEASAIVYGKGKSIWGDFIGGIGGALSSIFTLLPTFIIEVPLAGVEGLHLDNMDNSEMGEFLEGGGYMGMANHTLQDFYSHSNYVEIMVENGYAEDAIPTFDELDPESEIFKVVMSKIETTKHPDEGQANGHDGIGGITNPLKATDKAEAGKIYKEGGAKIPQSSDGFMAKDANGGGLYGGFKHPLHDVAKRLAIEATVKKMKGTTVNNAEVKKEEK